MTDPKPTSEKLAELKERWNRPRTRGPYGEEEAIPLAEVRLFDVRTEEWVWLRDEALPTLIEAAEERDRLTVELDLAREHAAHASLDCEKETKRLADLERRIRELHAAFLPAREPGTEGLLADAAAAAVRAEIEERFPDILGEERDGE